MTREVLDRIFEPFFTTKKQNEGTGMGMAVVHGIIKQLGGTIHVYSEPGKGTEFKILLPRHEMELNKEPERGQELYPGNERVLLVDDEDFIIDVGKEILESLGYQVTTRKDSVDALELFKQAPNAFDLLITDQTMPNMTGDVLAQHVLACRADIPVILCTGFSNTMNESEAAAIGIRAFLMKPIIKHTFARVVRSVLDEA
jgi:CheY-like chemotaxis protein